MEGPLRLRGEKPWSAAHLENYIIYTPNFLFRFLEKRSGLYPETKRELIVILERSGSLQNRRKPLLS